MRSYRKSPGCCCSLLLLIGLHLLPQLGNDSVQLRYFLRALIHLPRARVQLLGALIGLSRPRAELPLRCAERHLELADFRARSSQRIIARRQLCLFSAAKGLRMWVARLSNCCGTGQTTYTCPHIPYKACSKTPQGETNKPQRACPSRLHMLAMGDWPISCRCRLDDGEKCAA